MMAVLTVPALTLAETPSVTGVWQMAVQGDHVLQVGMELKQDGEKVTGIILMPAHGGRQRREVALAGRFVDGVLTLAAANEESTSDWATLDIRATMQADGTLTGKLSSGQHAAEWTAERLGSKR